MPAPTIVAGVWGYPGAWRPAEYVFTSKDASIARVAKSSLEPLVEFYNPEHVVIFIADTVAPREALREARSYSDVLEAVVRWLYGWLRDNTDAIRERLSRLSVEVVPNVGFYQECEWKFAEGASPLDAFRALTLRVLYEKLVDVALEAPVVRLVLDLTHGINYMPVLAREAALHAAIAASLTTGSTVELVLVNSEPYPVGWSSDKPPRLEVHVLGIERVDAGYAALRASIDLVKTVLRNGNVRVKLASAPGKLAPVLGTTLNTPARMLVERDGIPAAVVTLYGLPLAAAYLAVDSELDVDNAMELYKTAIDYFRGYTRLERQPCRVFHEVGLDYAGLRSLLYAASLVRHVKRAYAGALSDDTVCCNLETLEDRGVYIDELSEIAGRLATPYRTIVGTELHKIEETIRAVAKCRCGGGDGPRCEKPEALHFPIYCDDWPGEKCKEQIDLRNLLAHAGLEYNAIEATIDESGIALRYREGCWEIVKKLLKTTARMLAEG